MHYSIQTGVGALNWTQVFLILLFSSLVFGGGKQGAVPDKATIYTLFPTQAVAGFKEVKRKKKKIQRFETPEERDKYFLKNTVPVVIGPNGRRYMIDHHHFTLAALQSGYSEVYFKVIENLSDLSEKEFWKKMKANGWTYLKNNGVAITEFDLPRFIGDLLDDPYRSLAGQVKQAGAFVQTQTPFMEFVWADFFRKKISQKMIDKDFDKALDMAIKIAKSPAAKHLPGYKGAGLCIDVYRVSSQQ
ncbi:MAG: hypothetical protein JNM24_19930 [Bdellovibrionaceae bacterium]|nr:hypothetical protein [Pseudobdellovibrionaceae bacterium]